MPDRAHVKCSLDFFHKTRFSCPGQTHMCTRTHTHTCRGGSASGRSVLGHPGGDEMKDGWSKGAEGRVGKSIKARCPLTEGPLRAYELGTPGLRTRFFKMMHLRAVCESGV